jgi:hypothetical protein
VFRGTVVSVSVHGNAEYTAPLDGDFSLSTENEDLRHGDYVVVLKP